MKQDKYAHGLITTMSRKHDQDMKALDERLSKIEEKIDTLLLRTPEQPSNSFDYVVEVASPFSSRPTITGNLPQEEDSGLSD